MTFRESERADHFFEEWKRRPLRLMSLREVVNLALGNVSWLLRWLEAEYRNADLSTWPESPPASMGGLLTGGDRGPLLSTLSKKITKKDDERWQAVFGYIKKVISDLQLDAAEDRIKRFETALGYGLSPDEYKNEIKYLKEAVEDQLDKRYCIYVDKDKAALLTNYKEDWGAVIEKFKSTQSEILAAIRCEMVQEHTGAVFHLMRIAEIGLRSLAKERKVTLPKKPIEWATWQDIINKVRQDVDVHIAKKAKPGPAKDAALEFYNGSLGEFEAFKDVYRNSCMHVRKLYDEGQSASAMFHVREFMTRLARYIGEDQKRQVKWGLRY